MAKSDIWMKLYIGDYLADTQHLTTEEHGAYLLLLMTYYRTGPLKNDSKKLSQIVRISTTKWKRIATVILPLFYVKEDGLLHHKRADLEIASNLEVSEKNKDKARIAAKSRWNQNAPSNASSIKISADSSFIPPCSEHDSVDAPSMVSQKLKSEVKEIQVPVPSARAVFNHNPPPLESLPWSDSELIVEIALASPAGLANAWTEHAVHGKTLILSPILDAVLLEAKEQRISEREAALWLLKRVRSITGNVQAEPGWKRFWTAKRMHGFYANTEYRNDDLTQQHKPNGGTNGHTDRAQEIADSTQRIREKYPNGLPALFDRNGRAGEPSEAPDRPGEAVPCPALDAHSRLNW